jgi:hypothetical protein
VLVAYGDRRERGPVIVTRAGSTVQPPSVYVVSGIETTNMEGIAVDDPNLPPAKELIDMARAAMAQVTPVPSDPEKAREKRHQAAAKVLDKFKPEIDKLTDLTGAAKFLGLKGPDSLRRNMFRQRADGTPAWPEPDDQFGRSKAWRFRTIVIHQAEAPGRGHPGASLGRGRPKAGQDA